MSFKRKSPCSVFPVTIQKARKKMSKLIWSKNSESTTALQLCLSVCFDLTPQACLLQSSSSASASSPPAFFFASDANFFLFTRPGGPPPSGDCGAKSMCFSLSTRTMRLGEVQICLPTRMCRWKIRTRAWWMDLARPSLKTIVCKRLSSNSGSEHCLHTDQSNLTFSADLFAYLIIYLEWCGVISLPKQKIPWKMYNKQGENWGLGGNSDR